MVDEMILLHFPFIPKIHPHGSLLWVNPLTWFEKSRNNKLVDEENCSVSVVEDRMVTKPLSSSEERLWLQHREEPLVQVVDVEELIPDRSGRGVAQSQIVLQDQVQPCEVLWSGVRPAGHTDVHLRSLLHTSLSSLVASLAHLLHADERPVFLDDVLDCARVADCFELWVVQLKDVDHSRIEGFGEQGFQMKSFGEAFLQGSRRVHHLVRTSV